MILKFDPRNQETRGETLPLPYDCTVVPWYSPEETDRGAVVVERDGGAAKNLARELKTTIYVVDFAASKNYTKWDDWYLQVVNTWESILKK